MNLNDVIVLLREHIIFRDVSDEILRFMAFSAEQRDFNDAEILFSAGEEAAQTAFLVLSGLVKFERPRALPEKKAASDKSSGRIFGAGALIGYHALFTPTRRNATAVIEGRARLLVLTRTLMQRVLDAEPKVAVVALRYLQAETTDFADKLSYVIHKH